jgi:hypothetical protein
MYIWLKNGAEEQLATLKEQGLLGDIRVETHRNSGKKYVTVYEDVFDPASNVNFPEELIEKVTLKDRIHRGFRVEGIYRHEGATLMVKTGSRVHSEMMADHIEREEWQEISVAAPNVEKLKSIYTLVRQSKLAPEENWDDAHFTPSPTPAETETETAV